MHHTIYKLTIRLTLFAVLFVTAWNGSVYGENGRNDLIENVASLQYTDNSGIRYTVVSNKVQTPYTPGARIRVSILADSDFASPADLLSWTIDVFNPGTETAVSVSLANTVLGNTVILEADNGGIEADGVITWPSAFDLKPGEHAFFRVRSQIDVFALPGTFIVSKATARASNVILPVEEIVQVPIKRWILEVSKTIVTKQDTLETGDQFIYHLSVKNLTGAIIPRVTLIDTLDAALEVVSVSPSDGVQFVGQILSMVWTPFPANGEETIAVTVRVRDIQPLPLAIVNSARGATPEDVFSSGTVIVFLRPGHRGDDGLLSQPSSIIAGEDLAIKLHDKDINLSPAVIDTIIVTMINTRTGEKEYLLLHETGSDTGQFSGKVSTLYSSDRGIDGDGIFNILPGDTLQSIYTDIATVSGMPIDRIAETVSLPTSIALLPNPKVIVANGADRSLLTARITDPNDRPMPDGTMVIFTADKGIFENNLQRIQVPVSGGNGEAITHLIAPVLARSDTARVIASFGGFDSDAILLEVLPGAVGIRVFDQLRSVDISAGDPSLSVEVILAGSTVTGDPVSVTVTVDRNGLYVVPDIPPGNYELNTRVVDISNGRIVSNSALQQITVNPDGSASTPKNSVSGMVHGRGETTGARFAGAQVDLVDANGMVVESAVLDAEGRYNFQNLDPGIFSLKVTLLDGMVEFIPISSRTLLVGAVIVNADVLIDPFGITFDADTGKAIAGVTVTLRTLKGEVLPIPQLDGDGSPPNLNNINPFVTTSNGRFAFLFSSSQVGTTAEPARYIMTVEPPEESSYPPRRIYLSVQPADNTDGAITMSVITADGLRMAFPNSLTLTSDTVTIQDIRTIAFNIPLFKNTAVLRFVKTALPDTLSPGNVAEFYLTLSNIGNETAREVSVADTLSAGWTLLETDASKITGNILQWMPGDIEPGRTDTLSVRAAAPVGSGVSVLTNRAWAQTGSGLPIMADAAVTVRSHYDWMLRKRAPINRVEPGQTFSYIISFGGPTAPSGAGYALVDSLPSGIEAVSASGGTINGSTVTWSLGDRQTATGDSVVLVVRSAEDLSSWDSLVNYAFIRDGAGQTSAVTSHNLPVRKELVSLSKIALADTVTEGGTLEFNLVVRNISAETIDAPVTLTDSLPSSLSFVSATGNPVISGAVLSWTLGVLAPGSTDTLNVITKALTGGYEAVNTARLLAGGEDISASARVFVLRTPVVEIVKNTGVRTARFGDEIPYEISVKMISESSGEVTVSDPLPSELLYVAGSSRPLADYDSTSHTLAWSLSGMNGGETEILTFSLSPRNDLPPGEIPIRNVATATIDSMTVTSNPADVLVMIPFFTVDKTADPTAAEAGDFVTYQLSLRNLSTSDSLVSVLIRDHMPYGFNYVKNSARLDGVNMPPDSIGLRDIIWRINGPGAGKTARLTYRLVLGADAASGDGVNTVIATATTSHGTLITADLAHAKVLVRPDPFSLDEVILGRAWVDENGNGIPDENEPPVPSTVLLMEDGTRIIADLFGRFSIPEARPGDHVLRLLEQNIPEDLEPVTLGVRSANDPWIRFVTLSPSGITKANFPFRQKKASVSPEIAPSPQIQEIVILVTQTVKVWIERTISPDSTVAEPQPSQKLLLDSVFFNSGSDQLKPETKNQLNELLPKAQKASGKQIILGGHADSLPINKTKFPDNMALSIARTNAVKTWLISAGIDSNFIKVIGYGAESPIASNLTAEGRKKNRRVEIMIEDTTTDTEIIRRAKLVYTLGGLGIHESEIFNISQNLPSGYSVSTLRGMKLKPGESATFEIMKYGKDFTDIPAPTINHPEWGTLPLYCDEIETGNFERWTAEIQVPAPTDSGITKIRTGQAIQHDVPAPIRNEKVSGKIQQGMIDFPADSLSVIAPDRIQPSVIELGYEKQVYIPQDRTAKATQIVWIESPMDSTVSYRDRLTVTAFGREGLPMFLAVNGRETASVKVRPDSKADFLNISSPIGPVTVIVSQELPNGQVESDSVHIHVIGPAARISADIMPSMLPADSLSQAGVSILVLDEWGIPLSDGQIITLQLDNGSILTPDLYPEQPGIQVRVSAGTSSVQILAGGSVGEGRLTITADGVSAHFPITYVTPYEKMVLSGMATGQVSWQSAKSSPAGSRPKNSLRDGTITSGKAAFFARGTVGKGFILTTSYDSDRKYNDQVFRYLTPERVFPIYGDASSIFYEAPTTSPLFVRLAKNRSYVQYGDFTTGLSRTELSSYNRSFTGISSEARTKRASWNLFGAFTEQSIQVDDIAGVGGSGYYYLSTSRRGIPIVEGSERIVIQTRDRLHPENIVREEIQYRFTDYEIDYEAGTVLFKRPVPARSPDENSIIIVVTYETTRAIERHVVAGGRIAVSSGENFEMGTTVVGEEQTDRTDWLTGIDMRILTKGNILLNSEFARSSQVRDGLGWKIGASGRIRQTFDYDLYYRTADRYFYNPNSTTAYPGMQKLRGRFSWTPLSSTTISGEAFQTDDSINREERLSTALGGSYRWKNLTAASSFEIVTTNRQNNKTRGSILNTGLEWAATKRISLRAERDQNFSDEDINYRPTLNKLMARLALTNRMDIVMEHAFRDESFTDSSFTSIGIQSPVADNLTAYANYKIDGGISGEKNEAIVGLRHRWRPIADATLHTSFERMQTLRGNHTGDFYAYTFAGEYLPPDSFKASARYEKRDGVSLDKTVVSGAFDFTLSQNFSLLTKHTYLDEGSMTGSIRNSMRSHHFLSGIAYRPSSNDYLNALGKYEFKREYNGMTASSQTRMVHIGSLEMILEPRSQVEWFLRYACKVSYLLNDGLSYSTLTDLWMTNVRYEWYKSWDVLAEYRVFKQYTANDAQNGTGIEVGHIMMKNSRLAIGYNFTGYQDTDFSGTSYWATGPYLKIQIKFTESDIASILNGLQSIPQR